MTKQTATIDAQGVAEYLGISMNTTYALLASGQIPGIRVGRQWRVGREALDAFLRGETAA